MLTGNRPAALVDTRAYYQRHRWIRHIPQEVLDRYAAMHTDSGPTTKDEWQQWADGTSATGTPNPPPDRSPLRGTLAAALTADWPTIPCNRLARQHWGLDGVIPGRLSFTPGRWRIVQLPETLADRLDDTATADLTNPHIRRHVLIAWLQRGPADQLAAVVTFPQLQSEWPDLPLPDHVRAAWEDCFPGLAPDTDPETPHAHPAAKRDGVYEIW